MDSTTQKVVLRQKGRSSVALDGFGIFASYYMTATLIHGLSIVLVETVMCEGQNAVVRGYLERIHGKFDRAFSHQLGSNFFFNMIRTCCVSAWLDIAYQAAKDPTDPNSTSASSATTLISSWHAP